MKNSSGTELNVGNVDKAVSAEIYDKAEDLFRECWKLYKESFNGIGANRNLMSYRNLDLIQKLLTELEI